MEVNKMTENPVGGEKQVNQVERMPAITGVEVTQCESGIPLKGWDSVKGALYVFAKGCSPGRMATESIPYIEGGEESFVDAMLEEAQPAVESRGHWHRHYDRVGAVSFYKTQVDINRVSKGGYVLQLNAAFVGNQVEEGLAETLDVERGLLWKNVAVQFEPEGDQFRINFDEVAERLRGVVASLDKKAKRGEIVGRDIVDHLMKVNEWGNSVGPFVLGRKDGVEVTVGLGRVGRRYEYQEWEKSEDRWQVDGATISGPLGTDYLDETKFVPPSISISLRPKNKDRYSILPAVDPKAIATMHELAELITEAFNQQ